MRRIDLLVALAAVCCVAAAPKVQPPQSIDGPDTLEAGRPGWLVVEATPDQAIVFWPVPGAELTSGPPHLVPGHALFWTDKVGSYEVNALVVDWKTRQLIPLQHTIIVEGENGPDPSGLSQIMFLVEQGDEHKLTRAEIEMINSAVLRDELKAAGHLFKGLHDPDERGPRGTVPPELAPWFQAGKGLAPCVLLAPKNGGNIKAYPLPPDETALWEMLGGKP